jgi:hypothetical protein
VRKGIMGNVLSDEEQEERFLEDGFNLESPDADKVINYGTAAPVWQNKNSHSSRSLENDNNKDNSSTHASNRDSTATATAASNTEPPRRSTSTSSHNNDEGANNHSRSSNSSNNNNAAAAPVDDTPSEQDEPPKKLSYIQMAKLGYQELINAIIRPPRADYKVRAMTHSVGRERGNCKEHGVCIITQIFSLTLFLPFFG